MQGSSTCWFCRRCILYNESYSGKFPVLLRGFLVCFSFFLWRVMAHLYTISIIFISIFQWLWIVDSCGTQRKDWREMLRIWMCPEGKQRLSCGLYKGCDFVTALCVAPNHNWALTGIRRDQNPSHKLRKTLTQTLRGKSAKPYKMYEKKDAVVIFKYVPEFWLQAPTSKDPWGPALMNQR